MALNWCIYIWRLPVLKVNVKVMNIFTVNISKTVVTDKTNISVANAYEIAYWLSIVVFTFDLGRF